MWFSRSNGRRICSDSGAYNFSRAAGGAASKRLTACRRLSRFEELSRPNWEAGMATEEERCAEAKKFERIDDAFHK
jgi:hypothetical protein